MAVCADEEDAMTTVDTATQPELKGQAGILLGNIAGYVGHRTIEIGLRMGLIAELAQHPDGMTPETLASHTSLDPFYVGVWCQSAFAAEVLEEPTATTSWRRTWRHCCWMSTPPPTWAARSSY